MTTPQAGVRPASGGAVLVTGASRGIGLASALRLAQDGFDVWAGCRDDAGRERIEAAARDRGVAVRPVPLDVTARGSIDAAVDALVAAGGAPAAVVCNAGIATRAYFEDLGEAEIRRTFDVNVFGAMHVIRRVLPHMRAARRGRIVIMSSIAGRIGSAALTAYVASKFALEGFAESLALEVAPFGVRVVIVEPGIVDTDIWDRERRVAAAAKAPDGPYYEWFWRGEREADALVRASRLTPAQVAGVVALAITAPRPKLRYLVGRKASLLVALRRHLPGELFERLYFGEVLRRLTGGAVS